MSVAARRIPEGLGTFFFGLAAEVRAKPAATELCARFPSHP
jgi:hypothetical protein